MKLKINALILIEKRMVFVQLKTSTHTKNEPFFPVQWTCKDLQTARFFTGNSQPGLGVIKTRLSHLGSPF